MRSKQFILLVSASAIVWVMSSLMCSVVLYAMDKEIARQAAEQKYRCDLYGAEINQHAGREVCAPTPNG